MTATVDQRTAPPGARRPSPGLVLVTAAKVAVVVVLVFGVTHQSWSRFEDKGMLPRLVFYPLMLAVVPLAWWLVARMRPADRRPAYPLAADALVTAAFVIDTFGNLFDLYDTIDAFDDACHFLNWLLLTAGVGTVLLRRRDLAPWNIAWLCVGFGAVSAVVWEMAEYVAFVVNSEEFTTAYRDTMGDLTLGLTGSAVAAAFVGRAASRR